MNSRFNVPVTALALSLAVVLGAALVGLLGSAAGTTGGMAAPISVYIRPILDVLAAGAVTGIAAWMLLFAMKRDGYHRMEWVAFLPFNYGGRSPFDTSPFPKN